MAIFDLGHVQSWLDDQHGGDRVLAVTRVMTPANYEVAEFGAGSDRIGSTEPTRKLLGLSGTPSKIARDPTVSSLSSAIRCSV